MTTAFAHLRVHSDYSLGRGASKVKKLVERAAGHGQPAMALTDLNNLHGALELPKYALDKGLQPLTGAKVMVPTGRTTKGSMILLAQNAIGYANICRLVNLALNRDRLMEGTIDGKVIAELRGDKRLAEGIIAIGGCGADSFVGETLLSATDERQATQYVNSIAAIFPGRFYIEICRNGFPERKDIELEAKTLEIARSTGVPIVATTEVWYATEDRHTAFEILTAVASDTRTLVNCTADGVSPSTARRFHLRSTDEMRELFSDLPEAFENAAALARRCAFKAEKRAPILPPFHTEGGRSEADELRSQAIEGLEQRFIQTNIPEERHQEYRDRLEFELAVIVKMGFPGYFLIVGDFIKWAKANGIPVGPGRGSGAGSVVAWSLTITDLDPIRFGLLFERFLNPDRVSMPDFDVDFCQDRRGEVIHYVKDKYGADKVAAIATFMEIKSKTAIRDVGRVLSTPAGVLAKFDIDDMANMIPGTEGAPNEPAKLGDAIKLSEPFREAVNAKAERRMVFDNALQIEGLYRNASAHAAGIIIGGDTLTNLVPVGIDPKSGMPTVQFNMKDAESAGLVKFDFLGLKTLSVIRETVEHIERTTGEKLDIAVVPYDDEAVYSMLAQGRSNGVFQLESDGMKRVLRDIKPTRIEDLIAVVSLYRPGPMEMIPTYARRKNGLEQPEYPEPADQTSRFLGETFGIMVYQEQVMQVAQVVAGYTLGGADLLRRAMGKKIKAEMDAQKEKFIEGAERNGTPPQKAAELFDLIEKFSGYGFNKSHAAAYAVIAYQTAWLKCHYPAQFFSALMTYETSEADKMGLIKHDMDQFGIELLPPDINTSRMRFGPEQKADGTWAVRFGLAAIKGVTEGATEMISDREKSGRYSSLEDFHARAGHHFGSNQIEKLAEAGAFDLISPGGVRARAYDILVFLSKADRAKKDKTTQSLFDSDDAPVHVPSEKLVKPEWPDRADREFAAVGFFFREHPLDRREQKLMLGGGIRKRARIIEHMTAKNQDASNGRKLLGMVEVVRQSTWNNSGDKRVEFKLSERDDSYWVTLSSRRQNQNADEALQILTACKNNRQPVVVLADFFLGNNGIRFYGNRVWTADEYAAECRLLGTTYVNLSTAALRMSLSTDADEELGRIERAARAAGADEARLLDESIKLFGEFINGTMGEINEVLAKYRTDDNRAKPVVLNVVHEIGPFSRTVVVALPGVYVVGEIAKNDLTVIEGVVKITEGDDALPTDMVQRALQPA